MYTLLIGLDAFDPVVFERLHEQGRMPNLGKFLEGKGYSRFSVSNPPQSEVSWTSIATGANPGEHGMFDFVHRNPKTYNLNVSLLPTKNDILGRQFTRPYNTHTIFDQAAAQGFPSTSLWWPATFPARLDSPVQTIPGLGTPDILGFLGVATLFTCESGLMQSNYKTRIERFNQTGKGRFSGQLKGPATKQGAASIPSKIDIQLESQDGHQASLLLGGQSILLQQGKWSPIIEISFKLGLFFQVKALTRVILLKAAPDPLLYFLPLQIHPLSSPWRYATPPGFIKRAWKECGPFLTLGWPQDTTGLDEGWIDDAQFLDLCDSIEKERERILDHQLQNFDEGLLAGVFDTLDRVQHMFWRDRPDIIDSWYMRLDALVGRLAAAVEKRSRAAFRLLVVSDHGFSGFDYKVHLNRWLLDHGYLKVSGNGHNRNLNEIDWQESQAYAVGLNSLYLNIEGREGRGSLQPGQVEEVGQKLSFDLMNWVGPDGRKVIQRVYRNEEALEGPYAPYGPDFLVGYSPGYRASSETGLGSWKETSLEQNLDHWGADHCIDPLAVPGVLFSNHSLADYPHPSYRDIPALAIDMAVSPTDKDPLLPQDDEEDPDVIEERLKSLGYL
jgi:predicted AlkP superfamily phosphohydrolase/phosphomutase